VLLTGEKTARIIPYGPLPRRRLWTGTPLSFKGGLDGKAGLF